jgi:hypothetical protein
MIGGNFQNIEYLIPRMICCRNGIIRIGILYVSKMNLVVIFPPFFKAYNFVSCTPNYSYNHINKHST